MFAPQEYKCRCGVCGADHIVVSPFISAPMTYADGALRINCRGEAKHTPEEVRAAWKALVAR